MVRFRKLSIASDNGTYVVSESINSIYAIKAVFMVGAPYSRIMPIDLGRLVDYEIRASWWASLISWERGQDWAGSFFAWKVRRKHARYIKSYQDQRTVLIMQKGRLR